jgi:hypothetical protein
MASMPGDPEGHGKTAPMFEGPGESHFRLSSGQLRKAA